MKIILMVVCTGMLMGVMGCTSLNSVSVTPIPRDRANQISAQSHRWIIFGFNFDNDYVDKVSEDLSKQCPDGRVSGILTKDQATMYFLFFVVKREVMATGYCEAQAPMRRRRG